MTSYTHDSVKNGTRLKQLLRRGLKLQERIAELSKKKKEIEAELLGIIATFEDREKTDNLELTAGPGVPGKVSVTWRHEYVVDPKKAEKLRKALGDAEFFRCFSIKTSYSRAKSHGTWLKEAHGTLDRFKRAIQGAVTKTTKKTPTIKWESL